MLGLDSILGLDDNLEIKLAIILIFNFINTFHIDKKDEEYKALKVIVDKFEKRIRDNNELVEKFNKTGKF